MKLFKSKKHNTPSKKEVTAADTWEKEQMAALDLMLDDINTFQNMMLELQEINQICLDFITKKGLEEEFETFCSTEAAEAVANLISMHEGGGRPNVKTNVRN